MSPTYACELPSKRDAISLTDWIEAMMLVERRAEYSETDLRGRLVEQDGSIGGDDLAPGQQQVEDVLREVERRHRHAPQCYPFRRGEYGLEITNKRYTSIYSFLLWLSLPNAPFRKAVYGNEVTPLFDHVGQAALATLLGPGARALRFGWPVSGNRPSGPRAALRWLTKLMGLVHDEKAPVSAHLKDGGVDVVFWRPFNDGLAGFPILLAQCTVGYTEWERKGRDIRLNLWRRYLGLGWDPTTALVVPFCVHEADGNEIWEHVAHEASFLVDRVRLLELLQNIKLRDIPEGAQITKWTRERRKDLALR